METRPCKPEGIWPLTFQAAAAAGVRHLAPAPGHNRSHHVTGILMGAGAADDGFSLLRRDCLLVDGASDTLTIADTGSVLDLGTKAANGDFGIAFWIKTELTTLTNLFLRGSITTGGWGIELAAGVAKLTVDDGTSTQNISSIAINDGEWHFIVFRFDRSTVLQVYVDDVVGTPKDPTAITDAIAHGTTIVTTGSASGALRLAGVGIWINALPAEAALTAIYNEGRGFKFTGSETDITVALNLDEGVGTAIYDMAGNITGSALANVTWVNDGVGLLDTGIGSTVGLLETTADGSKCLTFPQAIPIGNNLPLAILETDGVWNATFFGFTDHVSYT